MDFTIDNRQSYLEETFSGLNVVGQEIKEKEFEKCNFLECSFNKCKFIDCTFRGSMLSATKFLGCSFLETIFQQSKVMGIEWSKVDKARDLKFIECDIHICGFSFMKLKNLVLRKCKVLESNFMESDCSNADFEGTDFEKSIFQKTNLTEASFKDAFNYAIDFNNNTLKKTKFSLPEATSLLRGLDIILDNQ